MIGAAGALVLLGLGLFVAGLVTDTTAFYWLCVGACVLAGVLLLLARVRQDRAASAPPSPAPAAPSTAPPAAPTTASPRPAERAADEAAPAPDAPRPRPGQPVAGDPPAEDVEVTDLLLVVDLRDEVLVVDGRPRYHLPGCRTLSRLAAVPLPVDGARAEGFTPCARCAPDRTLAARERGRRAGRNT